MNLVNEGSPVTAVPELDLYSKAPVQVSIEKSYIEEVRPLAPLNTGGHVEFIINNSLNEYVRLKDTTLYGRFHVELHKTTGNISDADWKKVHIVNNFMHSLWSQIDLSIGDAQTSLSLQTYPYKAYIETILGSTQHSRRTYLAGAIYNEDSPTNTSNDDRQRNIYVSLNSANSAMGKSCEFEGKLHLDLFQQHRSMIGGTKIKLKLIPHHPEFYFMINDDKLVPKVVFDELYLNVTKFKVADEVLLAQLKAINVAPVKYILDRVEVRSVTIDSGATSRNIENVVNGRLPRRVYIGFVGNDAYTGSFTTNPYNFENCSINYIGCFVNGEPIPHRAYTPDFTNDKYMREFINLYKVSEQFDNESRMLITKDKFKLGYTLFAFNLSQDFSQGYNSAGYVNLPRDGILRFEIKFATATTKIYNAIIYCEFDSQISIPEERNAIMDYR